MKVGIKSFDVAMEAKRNGAILKREGFMEIASSDEKRRAAS